MHPSYHSLSSYPAPTAPLAALTLSPAVLQDSEHYTIGKDMLGTCRLTIRGANKKDAGDWSCRLFRQKDRTNCTVSLTRESGGCPYQLRSIPSPERPRTSCSVSHTGGLHFSFQFEFE